MLDDLRIDTPFWNWSQEKASKVRAWAVEWAPLNKPREVYGQRMASLLSRLVHVFLWDYIEGTLPCLLLRHKSRKKSLFYQLPRHESRNIWRNLPLPYCRCTNWGGYGGISLSDDIEAPIKETSLSVSLSFASIIQVPIEEDIKKICVASPVGIKPITTWCQSGKVVFHPHTMESPSVIKCLLRIASIRRVNRENSTRIKRNLLRQKITPESARGTRVEENSTYAK